MPKNNRPAKRPQITMTISHELRSALEQYAHENFCTVSEAGAIWLENASEAPPPNPDAEVTRESRRVDLELKKAKAGILSRNLYPAAEVFGLLQLAKGECKTLFEQAINEIASDNPALKKLIEDRWRGIIERIYEKSLPEKVREAAR